MENRGWPLSPWERMDLTPYAFFHPNSTNIDLSSMKTLLISKQIYTTESYALWFSKQTETYPSIDDVNDGYFRGITNFQDLLPSGSRRR